MSKPRFLGTIIAVGFSGMILTSCLGTGIKTLGSNPGQNGGNATTDMDAFAITLAVRDTVSTDPTISRTVSLEGVQGLPTANLTNVCGSNGTNCGCLFYRNANDTSPVASVSTGISTQNNSMSCLMSLTGVTDPTVFTLVQLRNLTNTKQATGLITIKAASSLTIDDILSSSMTKQKVVGIYRYQCTRTFFEGEGVTAANITCTPGQHLGVINAVYDFYTYRSGVGSNSGGGDFPYGSAICNNNSFLKIQCTNSTPQLEYGFYTDPVAPFLVGVQMTRAPEAAQGDNTPLVANYGYAALPDNAGNCPLGLMKIRQWQAQPASLVQGGLDPYPTSFINQGNNLSNTVVEAVAPSNFNVNRQPNTTPCTTGGTTPGDCSQATFGGTLTAESVPYTALTPIICVIPPSLLSGLF
jgi:hypothetical protein